jgi:uncharacterized protein with PhoU and TrkA domain
MTDTPSTLEQIIRRLKQERDELQLQIHLAEMDAKDEYDRISAKIDEVSRQYEPVSDAAEDTAKNVISALSLAAEELQAGFHRLRKAIVKSSQ